MARPKPTAFISTERLFHSRPNKFGPGGSISSSPAKLARAAGPFAQISAPPPLIALIRAPERPDLLMGVPGELPGALSPPIAAS